MRGVRVGTRASMIPRSCMEVRANRGGHDLRRTDRGADGDRAHQKGSEGCDQGPSEIRLTGHFENSLFSSAHPSADRYSLQLKLRANLRKLRKTILRAVGWEVSPTKTWRNAPSRDARNGGNPFVPRR